MAAICSGNWRILATIVVSGTVPGVAMLACGSELVNVFQSCIAIFTALHVMQRWSNDENSVCLSVCLSVRHTRGL